MGAAVFDSDNTSDKCVRSEATNCHPVPQKYRTGQSVPLVGKNTNARCDIRGCFIVMRRKPDRSLGITSDPSCAYT